MSLSPGRLFYILLPAWLCLAFAANSNAQYRLSVIPVDSSTASQLGELGLLASFKSLAACNNYLSDVTQTLQQKGFAAASIDSLRYDSMQTTIHLYLGPAYRSANISTSGLDNAVLEAAGLNISTSKRQTLNLGDLERVKARMLTHLENNGYPFASLRLDSIDVSGQKLQATLVLQKGPNYHIDSIRIYGTVKIANSFLQRYLDILNGSIYQKNKLDNISSKLAELPYIEESMPWNLTMLGTGSILNLYLQQKKSSRVNVLIGLLPANEQTGGNKLLVTGDADINLRNALGNAETIGIKWQQIQVQSPRLNLVFEQPYLFSSPFGIVSSFDLFKKDSSFLNVNFKIGVQSNLGNDQQASLFIESIKTNLLTVDTNEIKTTRRLPPQIDVGALSLGLNYQVNKTNYRLNPLRGTELQVTALAGTRRVNRNSVILKLYDPFFSYSKLYDTIKEKTYRLYLRMQGAHYIQLGRQSTLKAGLNLGIIQSPSLFRNELFQIGGYRLLRGFDEESIYVSSYLAATTEFRYLIATNSFLFTFIDGAVTGNKTSQTSNSFLGAGLGLALETKAGIFNISYAAGKRNDVKFDIRQSKIHIGYVNYF